MLLNCKTSELGSKVRRLSDHKIKSRLITIWSVFHLNSITVRMASSLWAKHDSLIDESRVSLSKPQKLHNHKAWTGIINSRCGLQTINQYHWFVKSQNYNMLLNMHNVMLHNLSASWSLPFESKQSEIIEMNQNANSEQKQGKKNRFLIIRYSFN